MRAKLGRIAEGLFSYQDVVLDKETGEVSQISLGFNDHLLSKPGIWRFPHYSMGHVREKFMEKQVISEEELRLYELLSFPPLPFIVTDDTAEMDQQYTAKSHLLYEEYWIVGDFWSFFSEYTQPIAMEYCKENRIEFDTE